MRILNDRTSILKVMDSKEYEWFFSDSEIFIWFDTEEIPRFLKYVNLRPYSSYANLYKNGPDIMGSTKRYFVAPFTQQQERQLEDIYGQQKESILNKHRETRNLQMETEE